MPSGWAARDPELLAAALDLAACLYGLGEATGDMHLAAAMRALALACPARIARIAGRPADAEPALLEEECLVLLGARLGVLSREQAVQALALVERVSRLLPSRAQSSPAPASPPPPAAPEAEAPASPAAASAAAPRARRTAEGGSASQAPQPASPADWLMLDGSNFLGCADGYELRDEGSRDRLLFRLQEYAKRHPAHRVIAFFDGGQAGTQRTAGIEVRSSGGKRSADDAIVDHLRGLVPAERRRCTIVTNDRELARRLRQEGGRVEGIEWLAARLQPRERESPPARETGMSGAEVAEWERYFSRPAERKGNKP